MLTSIGEFEVKDEIGHGGMGRVYRAHDPRMGRDVAIKVLTNEGDSDLLARFHNEAGTTGKLTHKNIVTVYAFGEQEGSPFIVMELLPGEDLGRMMRENRTLTLLEKVRILHQVADGLCYAHQKDVIHRDVKPGNIMVLPDGTAKVMDFGIARVTGTDSTRRTQKGFFLGTISYMAPEQFKLGMDADKLVDIFAYGDVAYQLITGEHPFGEGDPGSMISRITSMEPRPIRELAPDCPEQLASIVHQLLAKDRDLRYQNLRDVLLDMEPVLYQLRHDRATQILQEVPPLLEQNQREQALAKAREALELDPMNREADQFKRQIQQEVHREAVKEKVDQLVREAEALASDRNLEQAIQKLQSALQLDKRDAIITRSAELRREQEKQKRAAQLVLQGREAWRLGKYDEVSERANEALQIDPNNTEAPTLLQRLSDELGRRQRRLREALEAAEACASKWDFDSAFRLLDQIAEEQGELPEIANERTRVRDAQARFKQRLKDFDDALAAARSAIADGNLPQARAAVAQIFNSFSDLPGAVERIKEAGEEMARWQAADLARIVREIDDLTRSEQFEAAHVKLDAAHGRYPDAAELHAALENVVQAQAARARADAIFAATDNIRQLRREAALEAALAAARAAAAEFPDQTQFQDFAAQIEGELQEMQRRAKIDETAHRSTALLESDPFQAADLLQRTLADVGSDAYLESLLSAAQKAVARRQEQLAIDKILADVRALRSAQEGRKALEQLERAIEQYPRRSELKLARSELRAELDKIERAARADKLRTAVANIKAALAAGNLEDCGKEIEAARKELPGESAIEQLAGELARAQKEQELAALAAGVRQSLLRDDLKEAARLLAACAERFSAESRWQSLKKEVDQRNAYVSALDKARQLADQSRFAEAEEILRPHVNGDNRAGQLLREIAARRTQAEEERERAIAEARERAAAEAKERAAKEEREREAAVAREREAAAKRDREAAAKRERDAATRRERERKEAEERRADEARKREAQQRSASQETVVLNPRSSQQTPVVSPKQASSADAPTAVLQPTPVPVEKPQAPAPERQKPVAPPWTPPPPPPPVPIYRKPAVLGGATLAALLLGYLLWPSHKLVLPKPSPDKISLKYQIGSGQAPSADIDFGDVAAHFVVIPGAAWITVDPSIGEHLTKIHVAIDTANLKANGYDSEVRVRLPDSQQVTVPVHVDVEQGVVVLRPRPASISFRDFRQGDLAPEAQDIKIPEEQLSALHESWQGDSAWFHFDRVKGALRISVVTRLITVGSHNAQLILDLPGAINTPVSVPVSIVIQPPPAWKPGQAQIHWKGTLNPGQTLTIQGTTCSEGSLSAGELPSARIQQVTRDKPLPQGLNIEALPSSGNGFRLKLRYAGSAPIHEFVLYYREEM